MTEQEYLALRELVDSYIDKNITDRDSRWVKNVYIGSGIEDTSYTNGIDDVEYWQGLNSVRALNVQKVRDREREEYIKKCYAPRSFSKKRDQSNFIDELEEYKLGEKEKTFSETVLSIIDEKKLVDKDVYHAADITKQVFSKLRSNKDYKPKKATAIKLCLALKLSIEESLELLQRASLYISTSTDIDLTIRYFISKRSSVYDVNEFLYRSYGGTIDELPL